MAGVLVLDAGNYAIKAKVGSGKEVCFVHGMHQLTEEEFGNAVDQNRGVIPEGFVRVNGQPYAVGEKASGFVMLTALKGAQRYIPEYYGVFMSLALAKIYQRSAECYIFASLAPRDIQYSDNLLDAAIGTHHVEAEGKEMSFRILDGSTFQEPLGGLMNVMLSETGQHYARTDINGGRVLVLDIGGMTTDFVVMEDAVPLPSTMQSVEIGTLQIEDKFDIGLRRTFSSELRNTTKLPENKKRKAIRDGKINLAGKDYDCSNLAHEATYQLLNEIKRVYMSRAGGPASYEHIILTGGGSALLHGPLVDNVLEHHSIMLADSNIDELHFANARGGLKLWRYLGYGDG